MSSGSGFGVLGSWDSGFGFGALSFRRLLIQGPK